MARLLGIDKLQAFFQIIKQNGGLVNSLKTLYRTDEVKTGTLVGTDKFGNEYYENPRFFYGRNRWVNYTEKVNLDYDASQVPPEWHRWLHYITDDPPTKVPPVQYKWLSDHVENVSGTANSYVPYSTTKPKIEPWVPKNRA